MGWHILPVVILVVFYFHFGTTLECGSNLLKNLEIGKSFSILSPNYPEPIPGDCVIAFHFSSPENTINNLQCQEFDILGNIPTCIDSFDFYAWTRGYESTPPSDLHSQEFCGKINVNINSTHHKFKFVLNSISDNVVHPGLISYYSKRRFNCTVTTLEINSATPDCGKNHLKARIEGGEEAQVHEWPWMVVIYNITNDNPFLCGGSLISRDWVLTAAHCFSEYEKGDEIDIYVSIGDHNVTSESETIHTRHINVSRIIKHERFNGWTAENDIAVLKLVVPIEYNNFISPVCLPNHLRNELFTNEKVTTTGWGLTHMWQELSPVLLEVDLQVLSNEECTRLAQIHNESTIFASQICANDEGKSACRGDSGGPLVWLDENNRFQIIGIVVKGVKNGICDHPDSSTIFTRVTSYIDWIEEQTNINFC